VKNVELKRAIRPLELPEANTVDLCGLFNSCNQRDIAKLILLNCQKLGYWTPTFINAVYDKTLDRMCQKNIIGHFGNNQYCLTNSAIKRIHEFKND